MIERTQSFKTSTGKVFESLEEAQQEELEALLPAPDGDESVWLQQFCKAIVAEKEKILDILSTGPRSRAKARKINRKPKTQPVSNAA